MKRPLFIIIGIVLVLVLLLVLAYLIFFKTPAEQTTVPNETYSDLNLGDTTDNSVVVTPENTKTKPSIDVTSPKRLRQLTTQPVVGFQEIYYQGILKSEVYYIESGTGHIYSINLSTGEEKRVSATTIPSSRKGVITPDGKYALVQSGFGASSQFAVGTFSTTSDKLDIDFLDKNLVDFQTTTDNTFLYLAKTNNTLVGEEYSPITKTSEVLFTIPFSEATIVWGDTATSTHYIYPKANSRLEGYLYKITDGSLLRVSIGGFGLSAIGNDGYVLYSSQIDGKYKTSIFEETTNSHFDSLITIIPDKCSPITDGFICASPDITFDARTPDSWYQGRVSYDDKLWKVSLPFGDLTYLVDVTKETGRELDIINMSTNDHETNAYFQNKNDQTLWLYQTTSDTTKTNLNESDGNI